MALIEPWQIAEIPGPRKATAISKPEIIDALIRRSKRPVMIIGHLAAEICIEDRKMIDYLIDLGKARGIPIIATGDTNRALLDRGYDQAYITTAVGVGHRLTDPKWPGMDGQGPHDLALFTGLPYYMAWTILSGLKNFAPHVRTISLDCTYQPNAGYSFANISAGEWMANLNAVIGHQEVQKNVQ